MGELITNLGIDWRLLIAQIANFFILLFILRRFLYKPLLELIDRREQVVRQNLELADELKEKSRLIEDDRQKVIEQARREAQDIVENAYQKSRDTAEVMLKGAQEEADALKDATQKRLSEREVEFDKELIGKAGELIALSLEKTLPDVLDREAHERVIEKALDNLKTRKK